MDPAKEKGESTFHFPPFLVHVALVLIVGWISSLLKFNLPFVFTLGLIYLYFVEQRINAKTKSRIRSEERKANDRKRLLSDAETARWLNSTVEAIWPIFMESFASQRLLMAVAPWFLEKYKPWTAKKVVLQQLCLGRSPPVFTMLRCGQNPTDGDHLVLEMDMKFVAASDMSAVIAVQVRKRVGLGLWTSLNISNIQIEGKIRVGVRFTRGWPVVERLRVCFSEAPILRMTAKPIINYGLDVTDLPGIAGWIDKMVVDALEQSLVEPNFLQVDVEKLVGSMMGVYAQLPTPPSTKSGSWFSVKNLKVPLVSILKVEILEGKKLKPSDPNGKADPYVKVKFGSEKYRTAIKHKTLQPTWHETFQFPVERWDLPNKLQLQVRDKDRFSTDDHLGHKEIECKVFNDGQRHDMWVTLDEVKTGQLHIAITVEDVPVAETIVEQRKDKGTSESERQKFQVSPSLGAEVRQFPADPREYENYQDSDLESEERISGEFQPVDVGYGQLGAVSIVTPGKEQVKEATNVERLRHRRKQTLNDGKAVDCTDPSLVARERKRSKLKNLFIYKKPSSLSDSSGELVVTETPSSTGEGTGDSVLEAADATGIEEQLTATNDVGTGRKRSESEAGKGGLPHFNEGEVNVVQKLRRVEGVFEAETSKSPTAEKQSQNSSGFIAPIVEAHALKESAHDVFSKLEVDCRIAVSTTESLIPRKFARSPGVNRSPRVHEMAVANPISSKSFSVTDFSPGASNLREQQDFRTVLPEPQKRQETGTVADGPPESEVIESEPPLGEENESAAEPTLMLGDNPGIESRTSLPPKVPGKGMSWRPLVKIVTDDQEMGNTPVASPTGKKESPRTPGGVGSASAKFLSRVTAFKDRGLRRSLSCRNPPGAFFASETKDLGEILRDKAESIRSQRNNMLSSAVLPPLTEGTYAKSETDRPQEARGAAARGDRCNISSSLSCADESSSSGVSALENVTSSASESLARDLKVRDDISRTSQYTVNTSTSEKLSLDSLKDRPANGEDGTSTMLVSSSGTSAEAAKEMLSMSGDSSFSGTQALRETRSTPELSSDNLRPNVLSPLLASREVEIKVRNAAGSFEEISSQAPDVHQLPENDEKVEFTEDESIPVRVYTESSLSITQASSESVSSSTVPSLELS
ncbi:hypothetical protein R1flu_018618 [Riccia fluitans]|uniref:C2 domain-containing protein n=1 Tax=Riccia fluitans TaxID=41844 RepID=A0ABD1ZGD6_9MARC